MSINKNITTLFAIFSLIITASLAIPVSAYSVTVDGNRYTADCSELQNVISNVVKSGDNVWLSEDCRIDLTIPSGKEIYLYAYGNSDNGLEKYTISNNEGDTITVEEGATLYLQARTTNSSSGKAVIRNAGVAHIRDSLVADNGAYTTINSGELNFGGLDSDDEPIHSGISFQNTGIIRIAQGVFDNVEGVKPYLIGGAEINDETGLVTTPKAFLQSISVGNLELFKSIWELESVAVGYTVTLNFDYPEYAAASGLRVYSGDSSILEVTGSNIDGWTITAKKQGETSLTYLSIAIAARHNMEVYDLTINTDDEGGTTNHYISNYIANDLTDEQQAAIKNALDNNETISVGVAITMLEDDTIEGKDMKKIMDILDGDEAIAYFDIELAIFGSKSGELATITDLGDREDAVVTIRIPAKFLAGLTDVKDGYTRTFYVVRLHDGVAKRIEAVLDGDNLLFNSGKFSPYAIAYNDALDPIESDDDADGPSGDENIEDNPVASTDAPESGVFTTAQESGARACAATITVVMGIVGVSVIVRKCLFGDK